MPSKKGFIYLLEINSPKVSGQELPMELQRCFLSVIGREGRSGKDKIRCCAHFGDTTKRPAL